MGLLSNGDSTSDEEVRQESYERKEERQRQQAALNQASETTVKANPQFLDELQDFDLNSEEFPELEGTLGPTAAGSAILGNRSPHHEERRMWLNINKGERIIAEADPGRLCKGRVREIAMKVHGRENKDLQSIVTVDERRAIRSAMERITDVESLSVQARLLRALTESVAVTRKESNGDSSRAEKASRFIG